MRDDQNVCCTHTPTSVANIFSVWQIVCPVIRVGIRVWVLSASLRCVELCIWALVLRLSNALSLVFFSLGVCLYFLSRMLWRAVFRLIIGLIVLRVCLLLLLLFLCFCSWGRIGVRLYGFVLVVVLVVWILHYDYICLWVLCVVSLRCVWWVKGGGVCGDWLVGFRFFNMMMARWHGKTNRPTHTHKMYHTHRETQDRRRVSSRWSTSQGQIREGWVWQQTHIRLTL